MCDNLGDHLVTEKINIETILRRLSKQVGNVYVKFKKEEDAEKAVNDLNNRWFGGRCVASCHTLNIKIPNQEMHFI